jgi:hypothetical protein
MSVYFNQGFKDWNEIHERTQSTRMSKGKKALLAINGEHGLADFASAVAVKLGGERPAASASALHEQLAENIKTIVQEMKGSSTTRGFVARAVVGHTTAEAVTATGLSRRTIQLAREEFSRKAAHDTKWNNKAVLRRRGVSEEEENVVGAWQKEMCPAKSGSKYHMQWITSHELYDRYIEAVRKGKLSVPSKKRMRVRCRPVFDRIKKNQKIRTAKTYDGMFNCMRCEALDGEEKHRAELNKRWQAELDAKRKPEDNVELNDAMEASLVRLPMLLQHRQLRDHQFAYLMQCRHSTIEEERDRVLVIMDFSRYFYKRNVTMEAKEKKELQEHIHDMVMVIESWPKTSDAAVDPPPLEEVKDEEKKEEKRQRRTSGRPKGAVPPPRRWVRYLDNLCEHAGTEGNDTQYVRMAMRNAIKEGYFDGFARVDLFSDGGPKHYKSVYAMRTMAEWFDWWEELRPGVSIPQLWWNFTAPYHGHGVADSHAGIFSQMLTRRQKSGQETTWGTGGGPKNAEEIAALMKEMKATVPIIFDKIERPAYRVDLFPLETIKKHFQFRFVQKTTVTIGEEGKDPEAATKETVVEFRLRSSDEDDVPGDPWWQQSFAEKATMSKVLARKKRQRETKVKEEPLSSTSTSTSDSVAVNGNRQRAIKMQAIGGESSTQPTRVRATPKLKKKKKETKKSAIAKSSSKGKGKGKGKGKEQVEMRTEEEGAAPVPVSRGRRMVSAAAVAVATTTKSGRMAKEKKR